MNLSLFILLNLLPICCVSQPYIDWQRTIGGNSIDVINTSVIASDGGYIFGGLSNSNISNEKSENSRGLTDFWVVKLNSLGQINWQRTIGGTGSEVINKIASTSDGGVILGGTSNSNISGEKMEDSRGLSDYWVVKLDQTGTIEWQKTIGGTSTDGLQSISQTSDGGYILGGVSSSGISGEKTENYRGNIPSSDYWIVKLDATGMITWQRTYGGNNSDLLHTIKQTYDGGYIVGGESNSDISYDKSENSFGLEDYWILKLDQYGSIEWQKTIGGNGSDILKEIVESPNGNYFVGGYSESNFSGLKSENSRGLTDFWVIKLSSSGLIEWDKTFGGQQAEFLYSLIENNVNELIVGGSSSSSISGEKNEDSRGLSDFWIFKLNASGNIIWQKTIGGSLADGDYSIIKATDNKFVLGGSSRSSISGEKTENCRGEADFWIVKINEENLSVNTGNIVPLLQISPNPTGGSVKIDFGKVQKSVLVSLRNIEGKLITENEYRDVSFINTSIEGPLGFYFLNIKFGNYETKTYKIIKQ